jgi:peptide/nickel transport system ATP-binding protein
MYGGRVAEMGSVDRIFDRPHHPYTWGLLGSMPSVVSEGERLTSIPGTPPSLLNPPPGCRFHPRCPYAPEVSKHDPPPALLQVPGEQEFHVVACNLNPEFKDAEARRLQDLRREVRV